MVADDTDKLTEEELIGQLSCVFSLVLENCIHLIPTFHERPCTSAFCPRSTLTIAAMDTTSNALSITLHYLAQHPEAQEKLRQELLNAQSGDGDIGYDDLVGLPYLDAICRETLRV